MAATPADDGYATLGVDARDRGRYAEIRLEDDQVLIYDQEEEDAWFQSGSAVSLDEMV